MTEVEFLEPPERPAGPAAGAEDLDIGSGRAPAPRAGAGSRGRVVAAGVLLAAAGGLSFAAAFGTVVRYQVGRGGVFRYSTDGWGRYHDLSDELSFTGHGVRYGIALTVVAAVYLLCAVPALATARSPRARITRWARCVAVGTTGLLLGVIGAAALQVDSVAASTRASLRLNNFTQGRLHLHTGSALWLGLGSLVAGLLGIVALWRCEPRSEGDGPPEPPPQGAADLTADLTADPIADPAAEGRMHHRPVDGRPGG